MGNAEKRRLHTVSVSAMTHGTAGAWDVRLRATCVGSDGRASRPLASSTGGRLSRCIHCRLVFRPHCCCCITRCLPPALSAASTGIVFNVKHLSSGDDTRPGLEHVPRQLLHVRRTRWAGDTAGRGTERARALHAVQHVQTTP